MVTHRVNAKTQQLASEKTVRNVQVMLWRALGVAELRGPIRRNPAKLVTLRRVSKNDDRAWLKWKLKYAYEPSFADRLGDLVARSSEVLSPWLGDQALLVSRIADTRNWLVHRDPEADDGGLTGRDLLDLLEDLNLVVLVCLLQDIGFANEEIATSLKRTRRWQFLEFRKREWK
jgi:hypothetical protein